MKTSKSNLLRMYFVLIIVKIIFFNPHLLAQRSQGIYLSATDFINHKISFTNSGNRKYKIKLHDYAFNSKVKIKCSDNVYKFCKDSIYGYVDWQGVSRRYYNKQTYTVLSSNADIVMYQLLVSSKTKHNDPVYSYHFSVGAGSSIIQLSIKNLNAYFATNKEFLKLLEVYFKNDDELTAYDQIHNTYKLNRLLHLSKTQQQ